MALPLLSSLRIDGHTVDISVLVASSHTFPIPYTVFTPASHNPHSFQILHKYTNKRCRCPNNTPSSAARPTSTSVLIAVCGSAQPIVAGKKRRISTREESLAKAKEIAEDWYLKLRRKLRSGEIKREKTFREVSEHYLREYDIMTQVQATAICGRPVLTMERSLGPLFWEPEHLRDHRGKDPRIPSYIARVCPVP